MIFVLIGNQNCGKTTLFNKLTGSNQHVGNFPGVTVESKSGEIKILSEKANIVDLPGIYSLSPYTSEEVVTRDFLLSGKADCIINILDASNLERNLYLTSQLMSLKTPMVLAFNMMDEIRNNGGSIDTEGISKALNINIVPISAARGEGITELAERAFTVAQEGTASYNADVCEGAAHRTINSIEHIIEDHAQKAKLPLNYAAVKLIEGDKRIMSLLKLSVNELELIEHASKQIEEETGLERYEALVSMRYGFIEHLCKEYVKRPEKSKEYVRSRNFDKILTHKVFGLPIFFGVMLLVFYLTFGVFGKLLSDLLVLLIDTASNAADKGLTYYGLNPIVKSLVIDGIFAGVGAVVSFLPVIIVLFFFLSLLEDSGYMARVAFIMDKLLRKIGLSGRSFVPMLLGFGCTVPAVLSARTIAGERDRKMTIYLTPFFSCSAKLPVYALFCAAFFPKFAALVMMLLYVMGIGLGILAALVLKKTKFKGEPVPFVMELPVYRFPTFSTTMRLMWERAKDFLIRAFTVIFIATIIIWFLQSFDLRLNPVDIANSGQSILAGIGKFIAPVFSPLGFSNWQSVTSLISGFVAKETVISTFAVLSQTSDLGPVLTGMFTPLAAFSFLTFILLYTPCIAAVRVIKNELKSTKAMLVLILIQTLTAYSAALIIYQIGSLFV